MLVAVVVGIELIVKVNHNIDRKSSLFMSLGRQREHHSSTPHQRAISTILLIYCVCKNEHWTP